MYRYLTFEEEAERKKIKGRVLRVLEFDKMIDLLEGFTRTSYGRDLAKDLVPTTDLPTVKESLEDTYEAFLYINKYGPIPLSFPDIREHLSYVKAGGVLTMRALLDVASFLKGVSSIKRIVSGEHTDMYETNLFASITALQDLSGIEKEITSAINNEDEMNDRASEDLYSIRKEKKELAGSIRISLDRVIRNNTEYLQEAVITIRGDRYCVPIKAEHKGKIPGIVHDTSSTGQTLFVEPMAVVEANNRIRELTSMERAEIERILEELTYKVKREMHTLQSDIALVSCIDLASAKAELAISMDAVKPALNTDGRIELRAARHPLIPRDKVVPVDMELGKKWRTLVITGPNTGGKTVSLKSCGLLTLMTMAGLMIPASQGSEIAVFDRVLADIGDEQSIEASLSTFSAHMSNIVFILKNVRGRSLVLLDELGSGTDPTEGAALAIAVLNDLFARDCITMATTHYKELKAYAVTKDGVMNAACEFDTETLSPTYRLVVGMPGASNAFIISKKLGLPGRIIDEAKSGLTDDEMRYEHLISEAESNNKEASRLREENERLNAELQKKVAELEDERKALKASKTKILNDMRNEQREILEQKESELDSMIRAAKKKAKKSAQESAAEELDKVRRRLRAGIKDLSSDEEDDLIENVALPGEAPKAVKEGEKYFVPHLNVTGVVTSASSGRNKSVRISSGSMTYTVKIDQLRMPTEKQEKAPETRGTTRRDRPVDFSADSATKIRMERSMSVMPEVMLIGMTVAEAESRLDSYIDDCQLAGISQIRIVHGKGTGALRSAVDSMLRGDPRIKSHRAGYQGEGDDGVTVATLN